MLYKDDNLEELFQKAAEEYPLKTEHSDWDRFAKKWGSSINTSGSTKTRMLKYALLMLLLGGTLLLAYKFTLKGSQNQFATKQISANQQLKATNQNKNKKDNTEALPIFTSKVKNKKSGEPAIQSIIPGAAEKDMNEYTMLYNNNERILQNGLPVFIQPATENNITITLQKQALNTETGKSEENLLLNQNLTANNNSDPDKKIIPSENSDNKKFSVKANKIHLKQSYSIYGILYGGPEFSTVKFQHTTNPGYRIGVAIGYRINNKLSIELGLQREHLNFYSNAKYIDTSLLKIKPNTSLETVNANSKLTSVPVTIRYNFSEKNKGHFFASAGVNALIITHNEQYKYEASKNGVPTNLSKYYASLKEPKYFTGVNISAGYETKVSDVWNLKVEPYLQAPINNFGVGRLPVTNFGIDIGIVKNLK